MDLSCLQNVLRPCAWNAVAIAEVAVAAGTMCLAWAAFKQMRYLRQQADAAREERALAKRPNVLLSLYGKNFATKPPVREGAPVEEALYFFLLNMSVYPVAHGGAYIYEWRPGQPLVKRPGEDKRGLVTPLHPHPALEEGQILTLQTGEHAWLVPVEKDKVQALFPRAEGEEKVFMVTLLLLYPPAPGGVALLYVPAHIKGVKPVPGGPLRYVGWGDLENVRVSFPIRIAEVETEGRGDDIKKQH